MTTERILAWMREQGFTVDEMLGGDAESLVLGILQGQPLDVKARRDAEQAARELLVMAEQTLVLLKLNKQVLYHPKVRESLGMSTAKINADIATALEDFNNAKILRGEDPIMVAEKLVHDQDAEIVPAILPKKSPSKLSLRSLYQKKNRRLEDDESYEDDE